jgi:hypothetical protein
VGHAVERANCVQALPFSHEETDEVTHLLGKTGWPSRRSKVPHAEVLQRGLRAAWPFSVGLALSFFSYVSSGLKCYRPFYADLTLGKHK